MIMRRRLFAAALVLVFTAVLFGLALAQSAQRTKSTQSTQSAQGKKIVPKSAKGARAVAENPTVQLGEVMEGQDYQHTFLIKNTGTAELQILSVRPG